jgi:HK97 family phage major capsid protein
VKVTGFTNNAAFVPEADSVDSTDNTGRKPWSSLTLVRVIEAVKTIAHGEAATKNALADGGQMRAILDQFLRYGLLEAVEDEVVGGTGGEGFVGILETPDIQSQPFTTDILTTARKAKTKVRTVGRARANAYGFHPNDWERFDLEMTLGGPGSNYRQAGQQTEPTLWGLPVFESEAIPEGTGLCADFRRAVFWDRQQTTVEATSGYMDFFMKNLVAVLAELRAGFGVIRPEAFVAIDLEAGS